MDRPKTLTILGNSPDVPLLVLPPLPEPMPLEFDGRKQWGALLSDIVDQGRCGSCWSFSAVNSLADRFNIMGGHRIRLSAAKMLICNLGKEEYMLDLNSDLARVDLRLAQRGHMVCNGSTLEDAWRYLLVVGVPTEKCFPYQLTSHRDTISLADIAMADKTTVLCERYAGRYGELCLDGRPQRTYRAISYYRVPAELIQQELWMHGPLSAGMRMYGDFYSFDPATEVYSCNEGSGLSGTGHAVRLVGWGENETDGKFWWVANTFGSQWGIDGYFKMRRGTDCCGIESNVLGGMPDLFDSTVKVGGTQYDRDVRELYENSNGPNGGIDRSTGYMRHFYKVWPELVSSVFSPILATPLLAAHVYWDGDVVNHTYQINIKPKILNISVLLLLAALFIALIFSVMR